MVVDKIAALREIGLLVGNRDPKRNKGFAGKFMVAEPISNEEITESNAFCIVGNNLDELVNEAFDFFSLDIEELDV
jgi:hypothetical protein